MSIPIVNSIASWFLKKRIHQMELFVKYPNEVQHELLHHLVENAKDTELGKKFGFESIQNYKDFSERVPLFTYEEFQPYIERARQGESNIFWPTPIKMFAKSSGTTNAKSKFIPISEESLEDCHFAAGKDLLCVYLNNNPEASLFTGKNLRLGGSKEIYRNNGTSFGDLSALLIDNMPFWATYSSTPKNEISLMNDWEEKMAAIIKETREENVTSLAGVPSWMLVLLNQVIEKTEVSHLKELWPNLEVYFHGGVSFEPYRSQYQSLIPDRNFKYYEIYNASEGFFAIQDQNNSDELLLLLDYGIFYEFIPMDNFGSGEEKAIPLAEVELGKNYALVITTNAGLWRYMVGDTVKFTSLSPYRIKITGRTKHFINVFGEELIIENTDKAIGIASIVHQADVKDYSVGPIFMEGKEKGAHQWVIEFNTPPQDIEAFASSLDKELQKLNSDYEAKRKNDTTLKRLQLVVAKENLFYEWLKKNDKLGGQHKIPRLSNSRRFVEELIEMNNK